jgi:hypothetical protein
MPPIMASISRNSSYKVPIIIFRCYIMGDEPIIIEQFFFMGSRGLFLFIFFFVDRVLAVLPSISEGVIMGSQNIMGSDYGSNISDIVGRRHLLSLRKIDKLIPYSLDTLNLSYNLPKPPCNAQIHL